MNAAGGDDLADFTELAAAEEFARGVRVPGRLVAVVLAGGRFAGILSAFTGSHGDYHTPRDTPDKLDYEAAAKVAKLLALIVRSVATAWIASHRDD